MPAWPGRARRGGATWWSWRGGNATPSMPRDVLILAIARQVFHVGPCGSGRRMKLVVNLVLGLHRAVLAEGLAFAASSGLDPAAALEALRGGPAWSRVMDTKGPKMLQRDFTPIAGSASISRTCN